MITTEQLFNEPFEPLWLTKQRQRTLSDLDESLRARTDFNFKQTALDSLKRISAHTDKRGNYQNTC